MCQGNVYERRSASIAEQLCGPDMVWGGQGAHLWGDRGQGRLSDAEVLQFFDPVLFPQMRQCLSSLLWASLSLPPQCGSVTHPSPLLCASLPATSR